MIRGKTHNRWYRGAAHEVMLVPVAELVDEAKAFCLGTEDNGLMYTSLHLCAQISVKKVVLVNVDSI